MYIDFALIDTEVNETTARALINEIQPYQINSITLPYYLIKPVKNLVSSPTQISCLIDFPLGISDLKTRRCAVEQAIKAEVDLLDVAMPQNLAANRKYDKIRDDIKNIIETTENKVGIRYILEYRMFDHHCLKKI